MITIGTLSYNPETGHFTRAVNGRGGKKGEQAGGLHKHSRYRYIWFEGKQHREHRLAWYFYYGEWPEGSLDHINRVRDDNRIINLRIVSNKENAQNKSPSKTNPYKKRGVSLHSCGLWYAYITVDYKRISYGYHKTFEQACEARNRAEIEHSFITEYP